MKQDNSLLYVAIGAALIYWFWKKKQPVANVLTVNPGVINNSLPQGISLSVPETTGIPQLVPSPATIMNINNSEQKKDCTICNCKAMAGVSKYIC